MTEMSLLQALEALEVIRTHIESELEKVGA